VVNEARTDSGLLQPGEVPQSPPEKLDTLLFPMRNLCRVAHISAHLRPSLSQPFDKSLAYKSLAPVTSTGAFFFSKSSIFVARLKFPYLRYFSCRLSFSNCIPEKANTQVYPGFYDANAVKENQQIKHATTSQV